MLYINDANCPAICSTAFSEQMYALVGTDLNTWMVANAGDGIHTTVRRNNQLHVV